MRGRVTGPLTFVVTAGDDLAVDDHHGSDGHVCMVEGGLGLVQSQPHGGVVIHRLTVTPAGKPL